MSNDNTNTTKEPRSIRKERVCVVGGAGFLGSHLVDHLVEDRECDVLVIDNLVAGKREFIHPRARFAHHDITQSEGHLLNLFKFNGIKFVFNYAAYPYVPDSYDRPVQVANVNFFGAMKVINSAHAAGAYCLQVSSAELYGQDDSRDGGTVFSRITEEAGVYPHSTYGASKAAIDFYVQARWKEAGVRCVSLRQFNCVGERDILHPYVIPEIILQIHHNGPTVRLGNNSSRDFMYSGDAVRAAAELLEKGEYGEVYNLGSRESVKIYDLAQIIGRLMGHSSIEIVTEESRKRRWEIWHLTSCNDKIDSVINYRPTVSLEGALRRTVAYFERNGWRLAW